MFLRLPTVLGCDRQPHAGTFFCFLLQLIGYFSTLTATLAGNKHLEAVFKTHLAAEILLSFAFEDTNLGIKKRGNTGVFPWRFCQSVYLSFWEGVSCCRLVLYKNGNVSQNEKNEETSFLPLALFFLCQLSQTYWDFFPQFMNFLMNLGIWILVYLPYFLPQRNPCEWGSTYWRAAGVCSTDRPWLFELHEDLTLR